jgi:hypothetical protein
MDPDKTLEKIRRYMQRSEELDGTDVFDLCEHLKALDEWLTNGGFPPAEWHHPAAHLKQSEEGH